MLKEITPNETNAKFVNFFETFAKSKNFNSRVAENWYNALPALAKFKGAAEVVEEYKGSMLRALMSTYPDIGLDKSKFNLGSRLYWTVTNRRNFFINIAKANGFDPLIPKNWYQCNLQDIYSIKGAWAVLGYYRGNVVEALLSLFAEIGLQRSKFALRTFWDSRKNRRKFLEKFAEKQGFNCFVPENWYLVRRRDIYAYKGGKAVLAHHNFSLIDALTNLFPECNFLPERFSVWSNVENGRSLLLKLAKHKNIDPLIPENWYTISRQDIMELEGGPSLIVYYNGSHIAALLSIFPDIGLQRSQFSLYNHWKLSSNRRNFFEEFAKQKKFDFLVPKNWYSVSRKQVLATKGGRSVLEYYKGRLPSALIHLFPTIGLQKSEFKKKTSIGRVFFAKFAKEKGFDPLVAQNWYNVKRADICATKEGRATVTYYKGSHIVALSESFPNIDIYPNLFLEKKQVYL